MMSVSEGRFLDAWQLRVLLTLLEEGSVTRAARTLDQSQPYVSTVLKKLREAIGDPILVRSGAKLVLTERARELIEPTRAALDGIERILNGARGFEPQAARDTFRIAAADCLTAFALPRLMARLRAAAPVSRVIVRTIEPGYDYAAALEQGEIDVVIANWPDPPKNLKTAQLFSEDVVCLFDAAHPASGQAALDMASYLRLPHLAPVARSRLDPGPIDARLAELGLERDVRVMAPEFNVIPHLLLGSDLVFTCNRLFARHFCALLPLRSCPAPPELGPMRFYLLWHERAHATARSVWLRSQIVAATRGLE